MMAIGGALCCLLHASCLRPGKTPESDTEQLDCPEEMEITCDSEKPRLMIGSETQESIAGGDHL